LPIQIEATTGVPGGARVALHRGVEAFADGAERVWAKCPPTVAVEDPVVGEFGTRDGMASNMSPQTAITNTTRRVLPRRPASPGATNFTLGHRVELVGDMIIRLWRLRSL